MTFKTITANDALNEALKAEAIYHRSRGDPVIRPIAYDNMRYWLDLACELEQKELQHV